MKKNGVAVSFELFSPFLYIDTHAREREVFFKSGLPPLFCFSDVMHGR